MHPDHHAKIIAISASIIVVIVLIPGLQLWFISDKNRAGSGVGEPNPYHVIVQSTTALKSSSIDDPKIQELNQLTSASGGGSGGDRRY